MSYSRAGHFDTQRWYDALMERRTREALRLRAREFEREHWCDSDAELLETIRERATELGYVPFAAEHPGAALILKRFGTWGKALHLAGLPRPAGADRLKYTRLYREEYRRQQKLHRSEKAEKLARRRAASSEKDR